MKKILHLTLKKKWFDLIASGKKTTEYREHKPYWVTRLLGKDGCNVFSEIHFKNGYLSNSPFMRVEYKGFCFTSKKMCRPEHGEILTDNVIAITLGDVLEVDYRNKENI